MRFTFARIGGFDPTDLWTNNLPDVPGTMSAGLQETPIATSTDRHDCRVTLLKLTPASSPAGGVNLHYRLDHAREGVEVTPTRMTAENARQVGCRLSACSRGEVKRTYVFELDPGRIQSLQAVVAIHTNRIFEFTDRVHLIRQISPD